MAMSNVDIWNMLRDKFPSFASHTAKGTAELFTANGFEALKVSDAQAINDFFLLSLRVKLVGINTSHAKDSFEEQDFGEFYNVPFGGIIQKMCVNSIKPISPAYKNLKNGKGPDQFLVRKPDMQERFWKQNFDYASVVTIPDDFQAKTIFINEYGMSEYVAEIMNRLQQGYVVQKFENKCECLNKAINSENYPLQDTQKMQVTFADATAPTNQEILDFILAILNVSEAMQLPPQTNAYNAYKYDTVQDASRLRLLVRPGWKNRIFMALPQVFHYEKSPLANINIIEINDFGGIEYYSDKALKTRVYPAYDEDGERTGWSTTEGGDVDTSIATVYSKDPNAGVYAMLADKGLIFEGQQNPYEVEPARNVRGRYTDYWASCPNNTIATDPIANMVLFGNFQ